MKAANRMVSILLVAVILTGLIAGVTYNVSAIDYVDYLCALEQDIINALHPGNTDMNINITLIADIDIGDLCTTRPITVDPSYTIPKGNGFIIPVGKDVIINLNGFNIQGLVSEYFSSMVIDNFGTLTLEDNSSGDVDDWGSIQIDSAGSGSGHTAGTYVIQNSAGTVTFNSGKYINKGGEADVPYVLNNMPTTATDVTTYVKGGYLQSETNDVFRLYDAWETEADNVLDISGGTLIGTGRIGWIQMGGGFTIDNPGKVRLNISGGELIVSGPVNGDDINGYNGVISVSCNYKSTGKYADVEVNISGGTLYSNASPTDVKKRAQVRFSVSYETYADGADMLLQIATTPLPIKFNISGGTFDNAPGVKNIDHVMYEPYNVFKLDPDNVEISGGSFTYNHEDYAKVADPPVACYEPASGQTWYYVNNDFISQGLANAGDDDTSSGIDTFELLRGNYYVDATTIDNTVKSDVELIVNVNAIFTIEPGGLLANNRRIINNGVLTVNGGTLQNNAVLVNNNNFYHLAGNVNGTSWAVIQHGNSAKTDASNSLTVFFIDTPFSSAPVTGGNVAGYSYAYVNNNYWAIVVLYDFTVVYDGNGYTGGSVPVDGNFYAEDDTVVVFGQGTMVRSGHAFLGWSTSASATIATYIDGNTFTITDDTKLYAVWQQNTPPTPTPTPMYTPTPIPSPSSSFTPAPSATATPIPSLSVTATPSPAPSATATPTPTPTPSDGSDRVVDPANDDDSGESKWAVVNLILSVVGAVLAVVVTMRALLLKKKKNVDKDDGVDGEGQYSVGTKSVYGEKFVQRRNLWLFVSIVLGVVSVVVFLLTEDLCLPMGWVDKWTIVNAAILGVEILVVMFVLKTVKFESEQKQPLTTTTAKTS